MFGDARLPERFWSRGALWTEGEMEVSVKFNLMTECDDYYGHWDEAKRDLCLTCGQPESEHKPGDRPIYMTAEGEKLAEFLQQFYGLEPIKPAQPGGRG